MDNDRETGDLGRRLDVLERSHRELEARYRAWRRLAIGLVGGVAMVALAGAAEQKPTTLEAKEFILRDEAGAMRASLAIRPDGTPGLGLFNEQGHIRASLDVGIDGSSGVNIYDEAGTLRAAVALRPDTTPAVGLFDAKGKIRRSIELDDRGTSE